MKILLDWILPKDMWKGFYLDPWVPVSVRIENGEIVATQLVFHSFWEQIHGREET